MSEQPILNLFDFEALAQERLTRSVYDYYSSGANDELTLRANRAAWERLTLRYRVLVDVSRRDASTTVLGQRVSMPVLVAPTAFQRLAHTDGELASVRAAGSAGTVFILSTLSTTPLEEVLAAATGPVWFQLYVHRDRGITRELCGRARAAGCRALVLTVDAPLLGRRERDVRNGFALPPGLSIASLAPGRGGEVAPAAGESALFAYCASLLDASMTWKDLEWLRSITDLPILVKGIVRGDDAVRAVERGVAGVVVSNHGGRQLDGSPATAAVLPEIVRAVAGRAEVLVDGGIRRGTDVIKALALGVRAVLVGRPILWALAAGGQAGVSRALSLLAAELDLALALCGCPTVADLDADLVA
jgi:4-hydroxymandelate oxidase